MQQVIGGGGGFGADGVIGDDRGTLRLGPGIPTRLVVETLAAASLKRLRGADFPTPFAEIRCASFVRFQFRLATQKEDSGGNHYRRGDSGQARAFRRCCHITPAIEAGHGEGEPAKRSGSVPSDD
jgi:hypothetical protein